MKRLIAVAAVCFLAIGTVAVAQRDDPDSRPRQDPELGNPMRPLPEMAEAMQGLQLRERQLDIEERELDLQFQRQVKELEIEKYRAELKMNLAKAGGELKKPDMPCGAGKCGRGPEGNGECREKCEDMAETVGLVLIIVHILLAAWIFQDIRKRNAGSGLWIVITLLIGFFGAVLYMLSRIGDSQKA